MIPSRLTPGVLGWLSSWTVSNVEPLGPRPAALPPPDVEDASPSSPSVTMSGFAIACAELSRSPLRGDKMVALLIGGGDLNLGEIGQRGVSLSS